MRRIHKSEKSETKVYQGLLKKKKKSMSMKLRNIMDV